MTAPVIELRDVPGKLLPERQRRRVLQVRAADLDDGGEGIGLLRERGAQRRERREQTMDDAVDGRDIHGGGEDVVRRLAAIDVVVRMHAARSVVRSATRAAHQLARAVRDDFVDVHVGLRARPRLPDQQRELVRVPAGEDLVGGRDDRVALVRAQRAEPAIDHGPTRA